MICDICGREGARIRRVARTYGSGASLPVIENIPVVTCPVCGESYMTAATVHELDRLRHNRRSAAAERSVPEATFP